MTKAGPGPTVKPDLKAEAEQRGRQFIRVKGAAKIKTKGVGKPAETSGVNPGARAGFRAALGGMSPRSKS